MAHATSGSTTTGIALPPTLECAEYRRYNADLAHFSDAQLIEHYRQFGVAEGRRSNAIGSRADFVGLIPQSAHSLEIGPFHNPLLRGAQAKYFDVMPREKLQERARSLNIANPNVPHIDFVSAAGDLSVVGERFDCVLSSHSIEHQPDLIAHLRAVEGLLHPGGRYFVLLPDKRYCFDHFIAESTIADVLESHRQARTRHTLKSIIEHRALTTHNDSVRHWRNDHGRYLENHLARTKAALEEYAHSQGGYVDVHAWYFTPASAEVTFPALKQLQYTSLELERLYPTRRGSNEFWFVLRK